MTPEHRNQLRNASITGAANATAICIFIGLVMLAYFVFNYEICAILK